MKRMRFPASQADYRRLRGANRPTIGLPDIGSVARVRNAVGRRQRGELENWNLRVRGATLTPGYADRMPFKFTGKLAKLTIDLK